MTTKLYIGLASIVILLITGLAQAHNPYLEPQALTDKPWKNRDLDSSFDNPFWLQDHVQQSQAIFGWLDNHDTDVVAFNLTPADLAFGPVIVAASTLPTACNQTKQNYPATALVGPGLPPAPPGLPFDAPPGFGVLVALNPTIPSNEERPIFHAEGDLNISWFLPDGLTEQCLLHAPWTCDFSNTISTPVFVPGPYYIVTWDPQGKHQNYTFNIGFEEGSTMPDPETEDIIRDNEWMHTPCTEPYPGN
jgi:hypothetical protein